MEYKIPLWKHQLQAIEVAKDRLSFGLFFEVGTGKTAAAINIARHKFEKHGSLLKTLVIAPPIVVENWRREWLMHSEVPSDKVIPLVKSGKERLKTFLQKKDSPHIFITNYEAFLMPELYAAFRAWKPDLLIFDELHKLKDYTAKRTKLAILLAEDSVYRLGLTGTPILNSAMDLWSQYRVLDKGETFGKNFFVFRNHYFYDKNAGMPNNKYFPDWKPRQNTFEEMNRKLQDTSMVVKKADCLDLPPFVRKTIYCDMTLKQRKAYEEMRRSLVTYFNDTAAVADLAITKALRLQQIVSGFVNLENDQVHRFSDHPRKDALKDLLEEMAKDHKIIIWAVFKENYRDIRDVCDNLKLKYVEVHGDIADTQKFKNVDSFNTDDSVRVFIGHPGSGGIGINLVVSDVSIFYSRNFSLEQDLQAEARNYRGGSERHTKVTRIDLVTANTIDEQVVERLAGKLSISDKILKDMVLE